MAIIPTAEVPSLSLLYRLRKLEPPKFDAEAAEVAPKPAQSLNDRIGLIRGDITKLKVDAIVNAANKSLRGGGGVDGAIHAAAGPGLLNECRSLHGCNTGSAKITKAYDLPCKKVIHAVGPIWEFDDVDESERLLAGCYATSLKLAVENDCKSIVFSALSTGIYGYPSMDAAPVAIRTVKEFLEGEDGDKLEKVVFCTFVQKDVDAYNHWLPNFFPPVETEESEDQNEDDWQEVKEGESAENGAAEVPVEGSKTDKVELPDVPKADPAEEGHAAKKQKLDATSN